VRIPLFPLILPEANTPSSSPTILLKDETEPIKQSFDVGVRRSVTLDLKVEVFPQRLDKLSKLPASAKTTLKFQPLDLKRK